MRKSFRLPALAIVALAALQAFAQTPDQLDRLDASNRLSCTSIIVGRKASADGSTITSHTCDGNYRTWMDIVRGQTFDRDTTVAVVKGRMHTDHSRGARGMKEAGLVPQPAGQTFSFLNTAYPCLNEHQLGMGETTISGRRELQNPEGLFLIEELQRIALQRCTTAREAIQLMGQLATEYGYGDGGECLTIIDPKETWHFEIFGAGPDEKGAVWAAVRIPDDHVGVSANIPRISTLNLKDKDNYMASANVYDVAKRMGWWDGKEPFKFWKAYSGGNYLREPKSFSFREYYVLNSLAPSLGLKFDSEELPISVKPDSLVSVEMVNALLASTYADVPEWNPVGNLKVAVRNPRTKQTDTVTSPVANPWMTTDTRRLLNALAGSDAVPNARTIAVPQCSYSTIIQAREWLPDAVGGVAWIAFDNPGQSPRIPVYAGVTTLPDSWAIDSQLRYDPAAAAWPFRQANKLATVKWGLTKDGHDAARLHFINKGLREMPFVEAEYARILKDQGADAAQAFLTNYTADFSGAATAKWDELARRYWAQFARAF